MGSVAWRQGEGKGAGGVYALVYNSRPACAPALPLSMNRMGMAARAPPLHCAAPRRPPPLRFHPRHRPPAPPMPGTWTWTDAAIFIAVFTGIRIAVIWMATEIFTAILPEGDACPVCNAETYALERQGVWRVLGARFRRSFCIGCGWDGVMRRSDAWMEMLKQRRVPAPPPASRR